jgi:hypothetical protein
MMGAAPPAIFEKSLPIAGGKAATLDSMEDDVT